MAGDGSRQQEQGRLVAGWCGDASEVQAAKTRSRDSMGTERDAVVLGTGGRSAGIRAQSGWEQELETRRVASHDGAVDVVDGDAVGAER